MAIVSYKNEGTANIAAGLPSKTARRLLPSELWRSARIKLAAIDAAESLSQLRHPSFRLHALGKDRKGQWSVAINDRYRICFIWTTDNNSVNVEIVDYH